MNANMIAPHCLIERHGSASRFQDIFVESRKWFRRRSELFRRFNGAPGRWRWRAVRWRDRLRKSGLTAGLPRTREGGHAGSAVRLKDHVDPYRNEQGDCRKPDQARDDIASTPARFPHPVGHIHSSAPSMQRWRAPRRGTVTRGLVSIHQDYFRTSMVGSGTWAW
jgi:hypothetical protein